MYGVAIKVIITPFVKSVLVLYFHHILVCARKYDSNCHHLVGRYLIDTCRTDTVTYRFGTVGHFIRTLTSSRLKCVCVWAAFYVVGCARIS